MSEIDKLIDQLAVEAARNVLSNEAESPGSQDSANVEAARQILGRLLDAATGLPECLPAGAGGSGQRGPHGLANYRLPCGLRQR